MTHSKTRNQTSRQFKTIGLVVPKIAHHFFASAIETIYLTAQDNNYEIIMTVSQEKAENEVKHLKTLLSMQVDGLLISITEQTKDITIFESLKERGIPLVFFDRVIEGLGFSTVTAADEKGSYDAIHKIIKSGYTKIAHLAGYSYTNIGKNRLNGFKKAMQDNSLDVNKSWIIETGFSESDGYKGFLKLFRSGTLPEVIFTVTYPVALGALLAAQEAGISVPDDIQILSFGGSIYNRFITPSISYIEQPSEEIGKKATELLISEIKSPDMREKQQIIIPTELVICETCKNLQE